MAILTNDEHIKILEAKLKKLKLEAKLKKLKIKREILQNRNEEMWRQWQESGCDYEKIALKFNLTRRYVWNLIGDMKKEKRRITKNQDD